MVEMTRQLIHGNGDSIDNTKSPTGAVGEREHQTMGCPTPNRTRTRNLILMGSSEDAHIHIRMTIMDMTTAAGG